jgi:DENN (AEX-3) domain/uDENN domain/dDENN domain/C1 domain
MAPRTPETNLPLADYFWIAGVDSQQLLNAYQPPARWSYEDQDSVKNGSSDTAEETIQEDVDAEEEHPGPLQSPTFKRGHGRSDSYQRLSQLSNEAHETIRSLDSGANVRSNRSSAATIKPIPSAGPRMSTLVTDADFDRAMQKFANDRESFFLDLNFSSAATTKKSTKSRRQTQRIIGEELSAVPNRTFGSVRRHLSFKDMSSARRQPSMGRRVSTRTSKRLSDYNSVVPNPEALYVPPDQHPLKRKFEPVLLDKYPRSDMTEEIRKRNKFPDYLPMFAFPNDITIVSSDSRPRSTWHQFSMTAGDNTKIPGVCLIMYIPLKRQTADELEKRCEEWRRANMTEAEREMASSLAERLALERAKLSRLLSQLPQASQESQAREDLEDEISTVEEKISVMSDMLRPLRHGAASKIEGLTDGDTGLWVPRAYGILGRDMSMSSFWRQWLRAIAVPMHDGSILRIPPSSPKVGMWQPLERYIHALCCEAPSPFSSKIQVDVSIRELHLYAKKEATNELPGSRTTDLYPLFRALTIPNIIVLMEYVLSESRIILLSSHTAMLQLVSKAILELMWPLKWAGVYIPVLPYRLVQALEAPCPYICGINRDYEKYDLPDDDFVVVDLDKNELQSTAFPHAIPKQIRRKLMSLLHLAAPHHHSFGVEPAPPAYTIETYPFDAFSADHHPVFTGISQSTNLAKLVNLSSSMFGPQAAADTIRRSPVLNAFLLGGPTRGKNLDGRPRTSSTFRQPSRGDSEGSPVTSTFPQLPLIPVSRNDSGYALQTSLREKRSGHFDSMSKRNPSISGLSPGNMRRNASVPFIKHGSTPSSASLKTDKIFGGSTYAPSTYAQSTLAASTIMPGMVVQPALNTDTTIWVEGHCLQWRPRDGPSTCVLCDEKAQEGFYRCSGCGFVIHGRCAPEITVVCPAAFYPDQIRAAFARCFASLFYTYKKFMAPATTQGRRDGLAYSFDLQNFTKTIPPENSLYIEMLGQTQSFNEFIAEREQKSASSNLEVALFDAIIIAKKSRSGRFGSHVQLGRSLFSGRSPSAPAPSDVLSDTSNHQWRPIQAPSSKDRPELGAAAQGRDYHTIISRIPAKLEDDLFRPIPKVPKIDKVPELPKLNGQHRKSMLRNRLTGLNMNSP